MAKKNIKVFLGGTCNESSWRDTVIEYLKIDFFNPVVDNWTEDCQKEEREQRSKCDYALYIITPKMTGVYSIAEVIDDSNKRPNKTLFHFLKQDEDEEFSKGQIGSLMAVRKMVKTNGGYVFESLLEVIQFLNNKYI